MAPTTRSSTFGTTNAKAVVETKKPVATGAASKAGQSSAKKAAASSKEPIKKVKDARVKKPTPVKTKQTKTKATVKGRASRQHTPPATEPDTEEEVDTDPEEEEVVALSKEKRKPQRKPKKKAGFVLIKGVRKWRSVPRDFDTITFEDVAEEERQKARAKIRMKGKMDQHEAAKLASKMTEPCYFLLLPRELRDIIYALALPNPVRLQHRKLMPHWWQDHATLPNILFVNHQIYEESLSAYLRNAVYVLDLSEQPIYTLAAQYRSSLRGLRANNGIKESVACLERIAKFKKVIIRMGRLNRRESSVKQLTDTAILVMNFLKKRNSSLIIIFDMYSIFNDYEYCWIPRSQSRRVMKRVEGMINHSPRVKLESLTYRRANRTWSPPAAKVVKEFYKNTKQRMLAPGESFMVGGRHW